MAGKKEMDDAVRVDLLMDKAVIEYLDRISENTRLTRSNLIRVACKILINMFGDVSFDKKTDQFVKISRMIGDSRFTNKYAGAISEMIFHDYTNMLKMKKKHLSKEYLQQKATSSASMYYDKMITDILYDSVSSSGDVALLFHYNQMEDFLKRRKKD